MPLQQNVLSNFRALFSFEFLVGVKVDIPKLQAKPRCWAKNRWRKHTTRYTMSKLAASQQAMLPKNGLSTSRKQTLNLLDVAGGGEMANSRVPTAGQFKEHQRRAALYATSVFLFFSQFYCGQDSYRADNALFEGGSKWIPRKHARYGPG